LIIIIFITLRDYSDTIIGAPLAVFVVMNTKASLLSKIVCLCFLDSFQPVLFFFTRRWTVELQSKLDEFCGFERSISMKLASWINSKKLSLSW